MSAEEVEKRKEFERRRKELANAGGLDIKAVLGHRVSIPTAEEDEEEDEEEEEEDEDEMQGGAEGGQNPNESKGTGGGGSSSNPQEESPSRVVKPFRVDGPDAYFSVPPKRQ